VFVKGHVRWTDLLQVRDILLERLFETDEMGPPKVLVQNLLGSALAHHSAQVFAVVLDVLGKLVIGSQLAQDGQDLVPGVWLGESEDALVLDVRVDEPGDVKTGGVADVDEVFWLLLAL